MQTQFANLAGGIAVPGEKKFNWSLDDSMDEADVVEGDFEVKESDSASAIAGVEG